MYVALARLLFTRTVEQNSALVVFNEQDAAERQLVRHDLALTEMDSL